MNSKLAEIHEARKQRGTHRSWMPSPPLAAMGTNEPVTAPIAIQVEGLDRAERPMGIVDATPSALDSSLLAEASSDAALPAEIV